VKRVLLEQLEQMVLLELPVLLGLEVILVYLMKDLKFFLPLLE
jgi:hypothetical protein